MKLHTTVQKASVFILTSPIPHILSEMNYQIYMYIYLCVYIYVCVCKCIYLYLKDNVLLLYYYNYMGSHVYQAVFKPTVEENDLELIFLSQPHPSDWITSLQHHDWFIWY